MNLKFGDGLKGSFVTRSFTPTLVIIFVNDKLNADSVHPFNRLKKQKSSTKTTRFWCKERLIAYKILGWLLPLILGRWQRVGSTPQYAFPSSVYY
jgi:hypothetical protein